jgi:hypothetical protein
MRNRILWFILLIWIFGFWYLFYLVFFVKYTWTLEITSNIDNFNVELYAKSIYNTSDYNCKEKKCTLKEISPFDYTITLSSPTYKEIKQELSLKWKKINSIKVDFIKDTKLTESIEKKEIITDSTLSTKELAEKKIEEIKLKKESNYIKNLEALWLFYFKTVWNNLELYRSFEWKQKKIWTFSKVEYDKIDIFQIYNKTDKILISLWDRKYILNLDLLKIDEFKLIPKIRYIKTWDFLTNYLIVTDLWTYTYDELNKELKYFYLFKDFVSIKDGYIWVIYKEETNKFINFSLKDNKKNLIINYNPTSKNREIILETEMDIDKIIIDKTGEIYFYNKLWNKYKLENY